MQVRSEPLELSFAGHSARWAACSWKASCGRSKLPRCDAWLRNATVNHLKRA